jgi:hypothetical protein
MDYRYGTYPGKTAKQLYTTVQMDKFDTNWFTKGLYKQNLIAG